MLPRTVVFVDTSIIRCLIGMDGEDVALATAEEFDQRRDDGQQFVIPVTTIVETGNQISQLSADRRRYAERLRTVVQQASDDHPPWIIRAATWDQEFLGELLAGDSTGSDLVSLLGDGRLGTGDVAILVERDRFERDTAYVTTEIWTLDAGLRAFGAPR